MAKKRLRDFHIESAWCKGCGICVAFCPKQVLALDADGKASVVHRDKCICCRECELRCPDLAIEVICTPTETGDGNRR